MRRILPILTVTFLLLPACGGLGGGSSSSGTGSSGTPTKARRGTVTPGGPTHTRKPTITPGGPTRPPRPTVTPGGPTKTPRPTVTPGGPTHTPKPTITPGGPTRTPTATIVPGSEPTLYVRSSGDDHNPGTSPAMALHSVTRAAKMLGPGSTVYVGPGHYKGLVEIKKVAGLATFPAQLIADPTGAHTGDPPGDVVLDADGDVAALIVSESPYFVADGFTLVGAAPQVTPKPLSGTAVAVRRGSDNTTIRNCVIRGDATADGIRVQAPNVLLFNNLIANTVHGISLSGEATDVRLINNTIAISGATGLALSLSAGVAPTGAVVKNNIIQESHKVSVSIAQGPPSALQGYTALTNIVYQPNFGINQLRDYLPIRAHGATDINRDADFVDSAGGDFHLKPGSPGIDAGTTSIDPALLDALLKRSTSSDGRADRTPPDIGYHYPAKR
jgi:hypothetical protein